ncbi:hypothetical protein GCM10009847_10630 [Leucobacter tardus]|uniref:Uncharacterized protein n=1 Tax=Leucobacter tardus TaxID=501483 RepID=A0A939QK88_9MICO|nr:hypothetical protein [Leucobacter tardus]MBO2989259.1 hypothetical protein [Leucobacter tardus]
MNTNRYPSTDKHLIEDGGVSPRSYGLIAAAHRLLDEIVPWEARSLRTILRNIHGEPVGASSTERRALTALLNADLVHKVGAGSATKYIYPGQRIR